MGTGICGYYENVVPKSVEWLWYPYIPYGKLTVIQGDPGEGKSTFVLNIVALLSRGLAMPDGFPVPSPCVSIYQCSEDGAADTIKPRLQQAGADCNKVAYIEDQDLSLTLEDGRIEEALGETGARVLIIDPIQAFIPPEADMQSAMKMRSILKNLASIAERKHCAVILIGHMNKGNGMKTLYRGLGSIDIAAIARSVLVIARNENNPQLRYMYPVKSSLAPEGNAIAFSFKKDGAIEWMEGQPINAVGITQSNTVRVRKQDKVRMKLQAMLEESDKPANEIYAVFAALDIGSRTVEKVKKELQIKTYRLGGRWYWTLPDEKAQEILDDER